MRNIESNLNTSLKTIRKHIAVINGELGKVERDIIWITRVGYYICGVVTILLVGSFV